jgi:hypothetical protein
MCLCRRVVNRISVYVDDVQGGGGGVVPEVAITWGTMHIEMSLYDSVTDPIKVHVHGFGWLIFDCVCDDAICH